MSAARAAREHLLAWGAPWCLPVREDAGMPAGRPPRIALIRTDRRLGNLLTITTLFAPLAAAWPGAQLTVVACEAFAGVLAADPLVHDAIAVERAQLWRSPAAWTRLVRRLRARRFDLAIDAAHSHAFSCTDALLTRATAAPRRVGFARGAEARFCNYIVSLPEEAAGWPRPRVYRELLRGCGLSVTSESPTTRLILTESEGAVAESWWGVTGRPRVLVHTGGRGAKRWPEAQFLAVARGLAARACDVVIACDPGERQGLAARATEGGVRVAPVLPVRAFAALLGAARLFVGGDAGPAHIAAALGVPRVLVFREEKAGEWAYGDHVRSVTGVPLGPTADTVVRAALEVIRGAPNTPR